MQCYVGLDSYQYVTFPIQAKATRAHSLHFRSWFNSVTKRANRPEDVSLVRIPPRGSLFVGPASPANLAENFPGALELLRIESSDLLRFGEGTSLLSTIQLVNFRVAFAVHQLNQMKTVVKIAASIPRLKSPNRSKPLVSPANQMWYCRTYVSRETRPSHANTVEW